jgi:DNA-binding response OmpR family regulator
MATYKVVLIDDDKSLLKTLALSLEEGGFEVIPYHLAASALIDIAQEKPDGVITDITMDGMDGLALIEELRTAPELTDTKFIVISGNEGDEWERKSIVAGARAYFQKPIDPKVFALKIKSILRG